MTETRAARFETTALLPDVVAGLGRASRHQPGPLTAATLELVKLRVSQLNGCAFCCDLHFRRAQAAGVDELALRALPGWRELNGLTAIDRACLALAEQLAVTPTGATTDAALDEALEALGGQGLAQLAAAVSTISAWNRLMVAAGTSPDPGYR